MKSFLICKRNAYKYLVGKHDWGPGIVGRKNKMNLRETGSGRLDWIQLARDRNQCQTL
jgi:hypothetical protein